MYNAVEELRNRKITKTDTCTTIDVKQNQLAHLSRAYRKKTKTNVKEFCESCSNHLKKKVGKNCIGLKQTR